MHSNVGQWLGEGKQTNQRAELAAIRRAVDVAPINRDVHIRSDSNYAIQCVTQWFKKWRTNDWKNATGRPVDNRDLIEPILERLDERALARAKTTFEWVKGHANDPGNVAADLLAVQGAEQGRQIMADMARQEQIQNIQQRRAGIEEREAKQMAKEEAESYEQLV